MNRTFVWAGFALLIAAGPAAAQEDDVPSLDVARLAADDAPKGSGPAVADDASIEAVLKTSVYVASKRPQLLRESPGVVSIVTREEIRDAGCRDLIDVLQLVPGFSFGSDVEGAVDVGFRGNWGHEGKVLLLVDGQEMNELLYSTLQLGNHFPIDAIERVEVIRGPGSAVYGGYAELAVINLVTRGAEQHGVTVTGAYGHMVGAYGHRNLTVTGGDVSHGVALSFTGQLGQAQRSDQTYTDLDGNSYNFDGNAALDPTFLDGGLRWRGLRARFIYDGYHTTSRDNLGENNPKPSIVDFPGWYAELAYDLKRGDTLTITPRLSFRRQLPWQTTDQMDPDYYSKSVERGLGGIGVSWDPRKNLNVQAGVEGYVDYAKMEGPLVDGSLQTDFKGKPSVQYENLAVYGQATLTHRWANVTVGARYELHSSFGQSFVPRVGITRVFGRFHAKLLLSSAFRAPGIENINLSTDLKPEQTFVAELETGLQINDHMFASANIYDITIDRPIVYSYDAAADTELYQNLNSMGTRGLEVDWKMKYRWGYADVNYSFYTRRGKSYPDYYTVPGSPDMTLGFPLFKAAASGGFKVWRALTVAPSLAFLSERYFYGPNDADGNKQLERAGPSWLLNLFVSYPNLGGKGIDVGVGVYDLLDEKVAYPQPYDGGHPPIPGPSREFIARLAYTKGF